MKTLKHIQFKIYEKVKIETRIKCVKRLTNFDHKTYRFMHHKFIYDDKIYNQIKQLIIKKIK